MGVGGDSKSLLEREPTRSKDRGLLSYNINFIYMRVIFIADDNVDQLLFVVDLFMIVSM